MTADIIERVAEELRTIVDGVTTTAGYGQTLSALRPARGKLESDGVVTDGKVIINQGEAAPSEDHSRHGNPPASAFWQRYNLSIYVLPPETETTPIETKINLARADLHKAIMADRTRGGLAIDTRIGGWANFIDDEGFTGVELNVDVLVRFSEEDPTVQA